jgi:DNA-binding beta-propeller fold protein YncE
MIKPVPNSAFPGGIMPGFVLGKRLLLTAFFFALWLGGIIWAEAPDVLFSLKSAPADLTVSLNGEPLKPLSTNAGIRNYRLPGPGPVRFSAPGYRSREYAQKELPLKNGLVEIKLEKEGGLELLGEYTTGSQPKSAYFSPEGTRLFVPLLDAQGADVFRLLPEGGLMVFEKRLEIPGSRASGFVEAMSDAKRRELWISNMEENRVHLFDLDNLEYKTSLGTGGVMPKVIVQSPTGDITVVSNWVSRDLSVFDSDTKRLLRRIPVGGTPRGMAFSSDGGLLYTAIFDRPEIAVVDMKQNKVSRRFHLYEGEGAARHVLYQEGKLYVSDMYRGAVNILDASTGALLWSRRIGPNINTIVLSPDGKRLFASSRGRNNPKDYTKPGPDFGAIYALSSADLSLEEWVWGRNQPTGLAISPDGKLLAFTDFLDANLELYHIGEH